LPARDADVHAALQRTISEIRAPRPADDVRLDGTARRINPRRAISAKDDRPDVALFQSVPHYHVMARTRHLGIVVAHLHPVDLRRVPKPPDVLRESEDGRTLRGVVAPN